MTDRGQAGQAGGLGGDRDKILTSSTHMSGGSLAFKQETGSIVRASLIRVKCEF